MAKILGLDLGTHSIGWAVVNTQLENNQIIDKGVRIFTEGVKKDQTGEKSKAAERTRFRSARKLKFRRKVRKINTLKVLIENNMCPLTLEMLQLWKDKKIYPKTDEFMVWQHTDNIGNKTERQMQIKNPYYLRAKAIAEKLNPMDLGRVFYHLAQRRGFKSNRLEAPTNDELIETYKLQIEQIIFASENIENLINELIIFFSNFDNNEDKSKNYQKLFNDETVSIPKLKIFFKEFRTEDENIKKIKNIIDKSIKDWQSLKDVNLETEKHKIKELLDKPENLGKVKGEIKKLSEKIGNGTLGQYFYSLYKKGERIRAHYTHREEHYKHEFDEICKVQNLPEQLKTDLYKAIFYQRPLRSQKGLVGKCTFERSNARCPVSHPEFEKFRMLCFINTIKIKDNDKSDFRFLNKTEKEKITPLFYRRSKPSFNFEDILKDLKIKTDDKDKTKFSNYSAHTSISGNPVSAYFKSIFGDDWETKTTSIDKHGQKHYDVWHVLFTFEDNENLEKYAKEKLKLNASQTALFMRTPIKQGYANLSLKAIKKINRFLEEGHIYTFAAFVAKVPDILGNTVWEKNETAIKNQINSIIDNHVEYKLRKLIVNDLIGWHKNEFNNADSKYIFDETDHKAILAKITSFYGPKTWNDKAEVEKNHIIKEISEEFLSYLRKSKVHSYEFAKIDRVDKKIKAYLKTTFNVTDKDLEKIYHPSDVEMYRTPKENPKDHKRYLGSPLVSSVKNPVAMKALHQVRYLINALIKEGKIDEETQIHIELARDLNDANMRKAIETDQRQKEAKRKEYYNEIKKLYKEQTGNDIEPTNDEILKYQLWTEQNHICLYTGKTIALSDFIGANPAFDIEHTIPRSLSYDNSQINLTLCDNKFNRDVKKNKIPTELANHKDILPRLDTWKKNIDELHYKIEQTRKSARAASTKEAKDSIIQRRHLLKFEYDYWNGKYRRFTMEQVPEGFKNSQLNDTRIITKFARAYLKTIFDKVFTVKGEATAVFRKLWGLQDYAVTKERINHIHHCIDAITIACMTKPKYDILAKYFQAEEHNNSTEVHNLLQLMKPWKTFVQDVKEIENNTFIYHDADDKVTKQTKKKLRKRGKIQYKIEYLKDENGNFIYNKRKKRKIKYILDKDGNKQKIYLQGDTIRNSIHLDTFYGAILNKEKEIEYVIRKELTKLKKSEVEKIVDIVVKEKVKKAIEDKILVISSNDQQANKLNGVIWMNEEKKIPINKVRIKASVTSPLEIKKHRDESKESHKHKESYYVTSEGNYMLAIYAGIKKDTVIKEVKPYSYKDISDKIKSKKHLSKEELKNFTWYDKEYKKLPFYALLKKGDFALFYEKHPDEINWNDQNDLIKRLYKLTEISGDGRIKLKFSPEARNDDGIQKSYIEKFGEDWFAENKTIKTGKSQFEYKESFPKLHISKLNFNFLIEGKDFKITPTGEIIKKE